MGSGNPVKQIGDNISKNVQTFGEDASLLARGDFNNFGNSVMRNSLNAATFYTLSPSDTSKLTGQTTSERAKADALSKQESQNAADAAAVVAAQRQDVVNTLSGIVQANKRAPGRKQTLLNGSNGQSNTLLTLT